MEELKNKLYRFEENINDSYGKLNFMYKSLINEDENFGDVTKDYADSLAAVVKSTIKDVESMREIFFNSPLGNELGKLKEDELSITIGSLRDS